jgi:non-canonical poly(A) RNA polymerase PAPD5/7
MEFFELYGRNFYYDVDGISLVRGGSYFQKARKGFYNATKPFLLSIEDPQQPGQSQIPSEGLIKDASQICGA